MRILHIAPLACLAAAFVCGSAPAHAHTFLNIDINTDEYTIYDNATDMLSETSPTLIGASGGGLDHDQGYFAENGAWYNIQGNTYSSYASALDLALGQNSTGAGSSYWGQAEAFFAADDSYYVIDAAQTWIRYGTAADMLANTNPTGGAVGFWNRDEGFFAVDGEYYTIDANNTWRQYATAGDLLNNVNLVASGLNATHHRAGLAADTQAIPEPSSAVALATLMIGGVAARRRRRQK